MQYKGNWGDSLTGFAPFIDGQSIERILEYIKEKGKLEDLLAFAVFK